MLVKLLFLLLFWLEVCFWFCYVDDEFGDDLLFLFFMRLFVEMFVWIFCWMGFVIWVIECEWIEVMLCEFDFLFLMEIGEVEVDMVFEEVELILM